MTSRLRAVGEERTPTNPLGLAPVTTARRPASRKRGVRRFQVGGHLEGYLVRPVVVSRGLEMFTSLVETDSRVDIDAIGG